MGRRHGRQQDQHRPAESFDWEGERTLAAAETEKEQIPASVGDTNCPCGSNEFLLEAFLQVVDGRPVPQPVEVETITCPQCGREFEAVEAEDGRILRGEFIGYVEIDE